MHSQCGWGVGSRGGRTCELGMGIEFGALVGGRGVGFRGLNCPQITNWNMDIQAQSFKILIPKIRYSEVVATTGSQPNEMPEVGPLVRSTIQNLSKSYQCSFCNLAPWRGVECISQLLRFASKLIPSALAVFITFTCL